MMNSLNLTGSTILLSFLGLIIFTFILVICIKYMLLLRSNGELHSKYKDSVGINFIMSRNKYPEVDVLRHTKSIFNYGVAMSITLMLLAFSYTQHENKILLQDYMLELNEELEVLPPTSALPPPPPPPLPPPVIDEVEAEDIKEDEEPVFIDMDISKESVLEETPVAEETVSLPTPPLPPPSDNDVIEIFKIVEQMPRFPGCEDISGTDKEKKDCADKKMLEYIYGNLKYPAIASKNGVEGLAVIRFVVNEDGSIVNVELARDPGAGTGYAALEVVKKMNNMSQKWTPGKQRGKNVRVLYTLPVKFKLEG